MSRKSGTTDASGSISTIYTAGSDSSGTSVQDVISATVTSGVYSAADAVIITRTGTPATGVQITSFNGSPTALAAGQSSILTVTVTNSSGAPSAARP